VSRRTRGREGDIVGAPLLALLRRSFVVDALAIYLYPSTPKKTAVDFATFAAEYLKGVEITAFEVSFNHPNPTPPPAPPPAIPPGEEIGSAKYDPANPLTNRIRQQVFVKTVGLVTTPVPAAVAVAIVDVPAGLDHPPGAPIYINVVLQVERNGTRIADHSLNYDVTTVTYPGPALPPPIAIPLPGPYYDDLALFPVPSLYLALPIDPSLAGLPGIDLAADGTPPAFGDLEKEVKDVLAQDPGGAPDLAALTAAQCLHIARELVSNRAYDPLPQPSKNFGDLYTAAPLGDASDDDRSKFETSLLAYYSTLDAKSARLAQYIFALSAAFACSKRTSVATSAGLKFPVLMNPPSTAAVAETEVILHG
jgi:hypothetical protein